MYHRPISPNSSPNIFMESPEVYLSLAREPIPTAIDGPGAMASAAGERHNAPIIVLRFLQEIRMETTG